MAGGGPAGAEARVIAPENEPSLRLAARLGFTAMRDAEFAGEAIRLLERLP